MLLGKAKKVLIGIVLSFVSLVGVTSASLAWFVTSTSIGGNTSWIGYTDGGYYESGTGTANDPFIISTPKHLYNLAWLQNIGKYNLDTNIDGNLDSQKYFKLKNDINMSGYVLPPIGTEQYPFLGKFDGNSKTVSNLTTSNHFSDYGTNHPKNVNSFDSNTTGDLDVDQPRIVGFFGVVGDIVGEETLNYTVANNQIINVTLNNYTVQTSGDTEDLLIGLAAGYVNGTLSGVKVGGNSKLTVDGESAITTISDKLSDYSLVGYTTKTGTDASGTYEQKVSQLYHEGGEGQNPDWGGSIAIKDFYNRLTSIRSSYASTNQTVGLSYDDTYDPNGNLSSHTIHNHVYNNNKYEMSATLDVYNEDTHSGQTYDEKKGAVQMSYGSSGIYYLSGGHYLTNTYYNYNQHSGYKIRDREGHYFSVGSFTSSSSENAGSFTTTDEANATIWDVPTDSSGYISTKYCYENGNEVTYYLYVYNSTTIRLSASTSYRTTFTRSVSDGYIRYSAGNYYLAYTSGDWTMTPIPTAPNPTTYSSYFADSYQIFYGSNYISRSNNSITGVATGRSSSSTYGWKFLRTGNNGTDITLENAIGQSVYVYTKNGNSTYYWQDSNTSPWTVKLVTNKNNASTYTITEYGDGYRIAISSYLVVYDSQNNVFSSRSANSIDQYGELYPTLNIETTQTLLTNYQTSLANTYNVNPTSQANVDGPDMYVDDSKTTEGMVFSEQDVTYLPLNVDDNLQPIAKNTGYIVGGSTFTSAGSYSSSYDSSEAYGYYGYGNVRISSFYTISDRLTNYNTNTKKFNANSVYTYDSSGLHTINDSSNTYEKYNASKTAIESKLGEGSTIYGLHFMDAVISDDNLVTARYARINGTEYTQGYQLPANSIDFNLKQKGLINFFAGTYGNKGQNATTVDSFFSLHQIVRSGSSIEAIYEIQEIYADTTSANKDQHAYVYKVKNGENYYYTTPYSVINGRNLVLDTRYLITDTEHGGYSDGIYHQLNSAPSGYTKVFDMSWLKDHSYATNATGYNKAFYFEIPVNAGEFALGSVDGKTFGAYLMYLDIGANASNNDEVFAYAVTTYSNSSLFPLGVDFATTDVEGTNGGETLGVIIATESDGDISFAISETTIGYEGDFATTYAFSNKTVTSESPPATASPPTNGIRLVTVSIDATDGSKWVVVVQEDLDSNGNITSTSYKSILRNGESADEENIPFTFVLADINEVVSQAIVVLTRLTGSTAFDAVPTYDGENYKEVSIALDASGVTISVHDKDRTYTININGTPINTDPQTYPNP